MKLTGKKITAKMLKTTRHFDSLTLKEDDFGQILEKGQTYYFGKVIKEDKNFIWNERMTLTGAISDSAIPKKTFEILEVQE